MQRSGHRDRHRRPFGNSGDFRTGCVGGGAAARAGLADHGRHARRRRRRGARPRHSPRRITAGGRACRAGDRPPGLRGRLAGDLRGRLRGGRGRQVRAVRRRRPHPPGAAQHVRGAPLLPRQRRPSVLRGRHAVQPAGPGPLGPQPVLRLVLRRLGRSPPAHLHAQGQAGPRVRVWRGHQQLAAAPPRGARAHRVPHAARQPATGPRSPWSSSTRRRRRSARSSATT